VGIPLFISSWSGVAITSALPEDAWERTVAMPVLIALRFEIPQNSADDEERTYLMSTMELYEQWEQKAEAKGREKGLEQGLKQSLVAAYRIRFGALPADLTAAIETTHDMAVLNLWLERFVAGTLEEIAAAVLSRSAPST
jgi:flagellar biosynthesis/type III secretory pathway protein FliH